MSTDLNEQIHELMERGLRPVMMADVESRAPVRVTALQRAAARSGLGHRRLILAGAAGIAACVALAVAALLPGGIGNSTGTSRLAAWTVVQQSDGGVMVTLRSLRDTGGLQRKLRADGIPARVYANRHRPYNGLDVPGCRVYPLGGPNGTSFALWRKVFYGAHTKPRGYRFWVYPAAIPDGQGVVIVAYKGQPIIGPYGINGISLYLVKASPQCTGSGRRRPA